MEGTCENAAAKDIFAKVSLRGGAFHFSCLKAKELCKCITAVGLKTGSILFDSALHQVIFAGDSKFMTYQVREKRHSGRMLLMSSNDRGRC